MNWKIRYAIDILNGRRTLGSVRNGVFRGRPGAFNDWYNQIYKPLEQSRLELREQQQLLTVYAATAMKTRCLNTILRIKRIQEAVDAEIGWTNRAQRLVKKEIALETKFLTIGKEWIQRFIPDNQFWAEEALGIAAIRDDYVLNQKTLTQMENEWLDLYAEYEGEWLEQTEMITGALLLSLI